MRIKHILVNWALDDEELLEPYEWEEDDDLEMLTSAKLIHVHPSIMNDLFYGLLRFEKMDAGDYLFCDGHLSLAVRTDKRGQLIYRSVLPFEYREAIARMASMLPEKIIDYDLTARAEPKEYGLTRLQREKKQWLLEHIELLDHKEWQDLCELISPLDPHVKQTQLIERLEHGYAMLHEYLYEQFVTQKRLS